MASRKSTPDIMGNLMGGVSIKEESHKSIKQELPKDIKPEIIKSVKNISIEAPSRLTSASEKNKHKTTEEPSEINELKEKVTMMLPVSLHTNLEDVWVELRKLTGSKQVSKSLIIQKSIEIALQDFEANRENSQIFSSLISCSALKQ